MRILAVETSCDETSIAILEAGKTGDLKILSNIVSSQIKIHAPFGGVVPMLAKREHQKNLVSILVSALKESKSLSPISHSDPPAGGEGSPRTLRGNKVSHALASLKLWRSGRGILRSAQNDKILNAILEREPELLKKLLPFLKKYTKPDINLIAVTNGPGLEPALWVGVNFAKALAYFWDLPVIPINHIEAHIIANWLTAPSLSFRRKPESRLWIPDPAAAKALAGRQVRDDKKDTIEFPAICLVVSGGHTQLVLMLDLGKYKILGETRDDAAGEAFDKLAKMLSLGYPGGPIISQIAEKFKSLPTSTYKGRSAPSFLKEGWGGFNNLVILPRPMLNSKDYDFSFSGLKTAALYFTKTLDKKTLKKLTPEICAEFQQAVVDVLVSKTIRAAKEFSAKTVLLSGGVASNDLLRNSLSLATNHLSLNFSVPPKTFCTDNAAMIALTAYKKISPERSRGVNLKKLNWQKIKVDANLRLA